MGTLVALHVAATAPDAVLSLTLFGPIGAPQDAARERLRERARLVRRNGMIAVADAVAAAGCRRRQSPPIPSPSPMCAKAICARMRRALPNPARRWRPPERQTFATSAARRCSSPARTIRSRPRPPRKTLRTRSRALRLRILARCGHWTPLEQPKECARLASGHIRACASVAEYGRERQ